ncbi:hypothetical protein [Alcaligenes aquatilis]|uniref:hypothetical protein n=1 Tax=Alcaligenes aquatilis TaxID=323284 RepID=UPI003F8EFF3A
MQTPTRTESQLVTALELCKKITGRPNPSDDLICAVFHSLSMEAWEDSESGNPLPHGLTTPH